MNYPRIIISGTQSGAGKTTAALGIMLALRRRGLRVQPFKTGPDYIDPTYHTQAVGNISRNLDAWLLSRRVILELFERQARNADISIIEGVMGLYDGLQDTEKGSTAHLAKILNCPVLLIVDARSLSRSAAALALGYKKFDEKISLKGVILNNIGSTSHYRYIKTAVEKKTKIPVLGYLPRDSDLNLPERHLGLVPATENRLRNVFYKKLSKVIEECVDIDMILKISRQAETIDFRKKRHLFTPRSIKDYVTIAVAKDKAFSFYYEDNLEILKFLGARVIEFNSLEDKKLPKGVDGVYIGGGFPELFARELSRNAKLKRDIYRQAKEGLPIYAECGGLMYLMEKMENFSMVGIFKGSVNMAHRAQVLGYAQIETIKDNILSKNGARNRAHIFHWSYLYDLPDDTSFAYRIKKSEDRIFYDGLIQGNVLASYAHLHFGSNLDFARNFVTVCRRYKETKWSKD